MKHWQEKRNYQHVRDEAGNVQANIITVDGIDVEVSDEVYLAYTQLDRREHYLMEEVEADRNFKKSFEKAVAFLGGCSLNSIEGRDFGRNPPQSIT